MDNITKELVASINEKKPDMIEQLDELCLINSGSDHLHGLAAMNMALKGLFSPIADKLESIALPPVTTIEMSGETNQLQIGELLMIRKRPDLTRRVLLTGHMDTVYHAEHEFQKLTYLNDNTVNGPGVADMKGGLVVMLHALQAFEQLDISKTIGWDVIINSDEEIGSLASSRLLEDMAGNYQAGLIYEPAMDNKGTLARHRKGSGKLTLIAVGKSAHAGRAFYEGRNAICYLSEAVSAIHALNSQREGVTINIGKISGGSALNVVPDKAVIKLDIRISKPEDEFWVREQLNAIIDHMKRPDYTLTMHGEFARPVKRVGKSTEKLFERIQQAGQTLGQWIDWKDSGGCCDGNNLAKHGLPVIDTLGVRGGHIHSMDEYILLDSLPERAALSALLLKDLASGGLEELKE